jgi:hypothetical protein
MAIIVFSILFLESICSGAQDANAIKQEDANLSKSYSAYFLPLDLLFGQFSFGLDTRLSEHWTLGPELGYWKNNTGQIKGSSDVDSSKIDAWRYILRGNWFYNGTYNNGMYIAPLFGMISSSVSGRWTDGTSFGASKIATYGGILIGYAAFGKTFGANFGIGYSTKLTGKYAEMQFHDGGWVRTKPPNTIGLMFEYAVSWRY